MNNFIDLLNDDSIPEEQCCQEYSSEYSALKDKDNNSLLQICYRKRDTMFEFLLFEGLVDVNNINNFGRTMMHEAIETQNLDVMYILLKNGFTLIQLPFNEHYLISDFLDDCIAEKTDCKFKMFEEDEFDFKMIVGKGTYGNVFLSHDRHKRRCALKTTNNENFKTNIPYDIFKEIIILKTLNRIFPESCCKIYGIHQDYKKSFYIVTEYLPYSLKSVLRKLLNFDISLKKNILMKIFRNMISAVNNLNECGICHLDLSPANLLLDENLNVKVIDMGCSAFIGLEKDRIKNYLETFSVKAPDDSKQNFGYLNGNKLQFLKNRDYRVNYSSDMFSLGVIIFSAITSQDPDSMIQFLVLKNSIFYFRRNEDEEVKLTKVSNVMRMTIENFSEHSMDFLMRVSVTDSKLRMTCYEAMMHPFFTDGEHPCKVPTLYSITDINPLKCLEKDVYTGSELILNFDELKYSEQILQNYSICNIQETNYDKKITVDENNLEKIIEFGYDKYCNYLIVDSLYFNKTKRYLDEEDSEITITLIGAFLENYMDVEDNVMFMELKELIIKSNLCFIPFKSLIIGRTNQMRLEGFPSHEITDFYNNSHIKIINFLSKPHKTITAGELIKNI